jgi:hypothetical protein
MGGEINIFRSSALRRCFISGGKGIIEVDGTKVVSLSCPIALEEIWGEKEVVGS